VPKRTVSPGAISTCIVLPSPVMASIEGLKYLFTTAPKRPGASSVNSGKYCCWMIAETSSNSHAES
jgi:hypothetical protein